MHNKNLYLICNSHIDPVWLWEWEEGLAETITTFRTAARLCREYDSFVFCHNEALLYQWMETYAPDLFEEIRRLVSEGKWHIMGGWHLQPDCNLPFGESFVRQILHGKNYFLDKFGVEPTTAINFDPFGHTRGLVQILKKSGYDSYLFCRPDKTFVELPQNDFVWVGYDGSEIMAYRAYDHYESRLGKAGEKIEKWLAENHDRSFGLILWGVGNHGGGASRQDLDRIAEIAGEQTEWNIVHGTPEQYFTELAENKDRLPRVERDLNPWAVGCYTSVAWIKQAHRRLENLLYSTEKMASHASICGLMEYPKAGFREALEDLLFCEFHDILPGSSIAEVEEYTLNRIGHGLEILYRLRAQAFFKLLSGQPAPKEGEFPIGVYNPHPYEIDCEVVCEFQPPAPNFNSHEVLWVTRLEDETGAPVEHQVEKESATILNDHRKRLVFRARLKASAMNRFSCYIEEIPKPVVTKRRYGNVIELKNESCKIAINRKTGLIDKYEAGGVDYLKPGSAKALVIDDYPDPWGMKVRSFRNVIGEFTLMDETESAEFAGVPQDRLEPVRIIEEGGVRTVVEALFKYNRSTLCLRYKVPKAGSEVEIEARVFWMEKDKMLKLSLPSMFEDGICKGQVAGGVERFDRHAEELVAQKWVAAASRDERRALTVINDCSYGFDFDKGEIRLSLLRSAAYSGHPVEGGLTIVMDDRFEPRIDQGERLFRYWINGGEAESRLERIDREALVKNEAPFALCCYPDGKGKAARSGISISGEVVQLAAWKAAEKDDRMIIRLFNPTETARTATVSIPAIELELAVELSPFELQTIAVDPEKKTFDNVDLMERKS